MATVHINHRDEFEQKLKTFLMLCRKEGIMREYKKHNHFTAASEQRRMDDFNRSYRQSRRAQGR